MQLQLRCMVNDYRGSADSMFSPMRTNYYARQVSDFEINPDGKEHAYTCPYCNKKMFIRVYPPEMMPESLKRSGLLVSLVPLVFGILSALLLWMYAFYLGIIVSIFLVLFGISRFIEYIRYVDKKYSIEWKNEDGSSVQGHIELSGNYVYVNSP